MLSDSCLLRCTLCALLVVVVAGFSGAVDALTISGQILDDEGLPLEGMTLRLYPTEANRFCGSGGEPLAEAKTAGTGRYTLSVAEPGLYIVRAYDIGGDERAATIVALVEDVGLISLSLAPASLREVKVVDAAGHPVAGACVFGKSAELSVLSARGQWMTPRGGVQTDDAGVAHVALDEGVRLAVQVQPRASLALVEKVSSAAAFRVRLAPLAPRRLTFETPDGSPGAGVRLYSVPGRVPIGETNESGLATLEIQKDGSTFELLAVDAAGRSAAVTSSAFALDEDQPHRVRLSPARTIDLRVVEAESARPLAGALVAQPGWSHALTDARGTARLRVVGEEVHLVAAAQAHQIAKRSIDASVREVSLALEPSTAIDGVVRDEDGEAVAGVRVRVVSHSNDRLGAAYLRALSRMYASGALAETHTDAAGRFRFGHARDHDAVALELAVDGSVRLVHPIGALEAGEAIRGLELTLPTAVELVGRVLDSGGVPVPGADLRVTVSPPANKHGLRAAAELAFYGAPLSTSVSGEDGRFAIPLAPGAVVTLQVRATGYALLYHEGIAMSGDAARVDLGEMELVPGVLQDVLVVDSDGAPVNDAMLFLAPDGFERTAAGMRSPELRTDSAGRGTLRDLREQAQHLVGIRADGFSPLDGETVVVDPAEAWRFVLSRALRAQGFVLDAHDEPLPGVEVSAYRVDTYFGEEQPSVPIASARSGADGSFTLEIPRYAERILFFAEPKGYAATSTRSYPYAADALPESIVLKLQREAVVRGRVLDTYANPVVGANVGEDSGGNRHLRNKAVTDAEGRFELGRLVPGSTVMLRIDREGYPTHRESVEIPGDEARVEIRVDGGRRVTGVVVDEWGAPLAGARVELAEATRTFGGPETGSGPDGRFVIEGVKAGHYFLRASLEGYGMDGKGQALDLTVEDPPEQLVELESRATIVGQLHGLEELASVRPIVAAMGPNGSREPTVAPDGSFRIEGAEPGRWLFQATEPNAGLTAKGDLEVPKGAGEAFVELQLEPGFTMEVLVRRGGAPARGAEVRLSASSVSTTFNRTSGADGRASFSGLSAGSYTVMASPPGAGPFRAMVKEQIEVAGDQNVILDLPEARLAGVVRRSADRVPVAEAEVWAVAAEPSGFVPRKLRSGPDGEFVFEELAEGTWLVGARKDGAAAPEQRVELTGDGSHNEVELLLEDASGLTLRVEGARYLWPDRLHVVRMDAAGNVVGTHDPILDSDGRARLESLPGGVLSLLVRGRRFASVELGPVAPGDGNEVIVPLTPACQLEVHVSGMPATGTPGTVRVMDATGRVVRFPFGVSLSSEWPLGARGAHITDLPAGTFRVYVDAGDGRTWDQEVTLDSAQPARLDL